MARKRNPIDPALLDCAKAYLRAMASRRPPRPDDAAGWQRFFVLCDDLIRKFAMNFRMSVDDLDDCVQEVWVHLIRRLRVFEYDPKRGAFHTWLYRVVHDTTVDYFRHQRRFRRTAAQSAEIEPVDEHDDPSQQCAAAESHRDTANMLSVIQRHVSRPNYRLLQMRWIEGRSVSEVAAALNLTHQQVWYREHRARKKLRRVLADEVE